MHQISLIVLNLHSTLQSMSKSAAVVFPTNPIDHFSCSRFLKELFAPTINPTAPIAVTAVHNVYMRDYLFRRTEQNGTNICWMV